MNEPETGPPGGGRLMAGQRGGPDSWHALGAHTPARIALGRTGGSLRTASLLGFRVAHAGARDAVQADFDIAALEEAFGQHGLATERLATCARQRASFLLRPDLGRLLDSEAEVRLRELASTWGRRDIAVLVSDGLSARAAGSHAVETVVELARLLSGAGWTLYPVFIVPFARVKLQDAVGEILGARHSVILLGERPGLSAHDSLGAYLTYCPRSDRTDADRNCVSNIRGGGLPPLEAARKVARMLFESRRLSLSGPRLRDM